MTKIPVGSGQGVRVFKQVLVVVVGVRIKSEVSQSFPE